LTEKNKKIIIFLIEFVNQPV